MVSIEIAINVEIVLFIFLFIFTKQINMYLLFLVFLFIHELCHMIMGTVLGFKPQKLIIMPFGLKIRFKDIRTNKKVEYKKIAIAIAGPTVNILLIILALVFDLHRNIVFVNLIIALFNLIPIYPLDGGRILKSILNIKKDPQKAYRIVNRISNYSIIILTAISSILVLYYKNINLLFVVIYLWYVVIKENKRYNIIKRVFDVMEIKK